MTERHGASHRITQTRPGSGNSTDQVRQMRVLKGNVTRTRNKVDKLEGEYGARDVPQSSPYYPKIAAARQSHADARRAWAEHTAMGTGTLDEVLAGEGPQRRERDES